MVATAVGADAVVVVVVSAGVVGMLVCAGSGWIAGGNSDR